MKTTILLLPIIVLLASCESRKVDKSFEKDFEYALHIVVNHDKAVGVVYDVWAARFFFSQEYLKLLTEIPGSFGIFDPSPYYDTKDDYLQDIKKWKNWYSENKYNITKEYSDSIKKLAWESHIWW